MASVRFPPIADIDGYCHARPMVEHCCEMMTANVNAKCEKHPNRYDCPDCLVDYWPKSRTYGLIIHDGGESIIVISHCPWCGTKLPERLQ